MAWTVPASPRAAVSSSRLVVAIPPAVGSARTQMVLTDIDASSECFLLLEERDDARGAVALVLHDLALGPRLGGDDVEDLLARPGEPHLAVEAKVRDGHLV